MALPLLQIGWNLGKLWFKPEGNLQPSTFQGLDSLTPSERQLLFTLFVLSPQGKEFMERPSTKQIIKGFFDMQKYMIQSASKNRSFGLTMSIVNARLWNITGIIDDLTLRLIYIATGFKEGTSLLSDIADLAGKVIPLAGLGDSGDSGAIHFSNEVTYVEGEETKRVLRTTGDKLP